VLNVASEFPTIGIPLSPIVKLLVYFCTLERLKVLSFIAASAAPVIRVFGLLNGVSNSLATCAKTGVLIGTEAPKIQFAT
jgi:hypothetical protein